MLVAFIKYFFIILFSFYLYIKLLNLQNITKLKILIYFLFSIGLAWLISFYRSSKTHVGIPIMIIPFFIAVTLLNKVNMQLSLTTTIISCGISNALFTIAVIIGSIIFYLLKIDSSTSLYLIIFAIFIEYLLIHQLFKFKRLKKGMPFLVDKSKNNIGIIISVAILCSNTLLNNDSLDLIYIIPTVLIILCTIFIFVWWDNHLTKTYMERLRKSEIIELRSILHEKEEQIRKLEYQNEIYAKMIHKDNKLIPIMEMSVNNYIQSCIDKDCDNPSERGASILRDLKSYSQERYGVLNEYKLHSQHLPTTSISSLNSLFTYFSKKSDTCKISFNISISGNLNYFVQHIITESAINTLLSDLIENSIFAVKNVTSKKIFVSIGIIENYYIINVFDSGILFETDVLISLGLKKITTHPMNGGSGIGLMTIFEILKKYKASILIEEFSSHIDNSYTKKISIRFDQKNQYILKTYRFKQINPIERSDMIILQNS